MKINYVLVLVLLSVSLCKRSSLRTPIEEAVRPFSGTFAVTWLAGFCYNSTSKCSQESLDMWDKYDYSLPRESFTIHGLWPCAKVYGSNYSNFSYSNIQDNSELWTEMLNYWPAKSNLNKSDDWLWDHEYNEHGKDYSRILQTYHPEHFGKASNRELQQLYFATGIEFYKERKLQKINLTAAHPPVGFDKEGSVVLNKTQLAKIIDIHVDYFHVSCLSTDKEILQEIKICFRIQETLEKTYESCRKIKENSETIYSMNDNCLPKFKLIGYKDPNAPSQTEVTKYPQSKQEVAKHHQNPPEDIKHSHRSQEM